MAEEPGDFLFSSALSPSWKRPDEVMRLHRLKQKKKALQARMNKTDIPRTVDKSNLSLKDDSVSQKRKNPFQARLEKRPRIEQENVNLSNLELSSDTTLFQLLSGNSRPQPSGTPLQTSFTSILSQLSGNNSQVSSVETDEGPKGEKFIPIDWSLKTKVRFMSPNPFAWSQKLRTCEEASGITGFVRCLDTGLNASENICSSRSLDTSPNARFHQCCLVWQHPSLPWFELFPRSAARLTSATNNIIGANQSIKDCLHREWGESFRSLFQLTRARQCPYFYVCANSFTCLFRAAGILGFTDIHALLTPTTRGFRQLLKQEDVVYTMPLRKSMSSSFKRLSLESADTGYETLDSLVDEHSQCNSSNASFAGRSTRELADGGDIDEDEDEPADEWLESMGVAAEEIRKIKNKQVRNVGFTSESPFTRHTDVMLVFDSGCLQVRQSVVKVDSENYHSIELRGPILPHAIHNLCGLLQQSSEEFSATFATLESTRPFSSVREVSVENPENSEPTDCMKSPEKTDSCSGPVRTPTKTHVTSVFGKENLSDCGLQPSVLQKFCCPDTSRVQLVDSLKLNVDSTYSWS
ncbi:hypothetical protein ANN_16873 [Periplaneta americana]|uniref:Protein downstream neighbor of son homolog n=1 Tax=Periplaneta americana TaxID=6978 RepID=A0ABQ8SSN8_PERAM|nr:hypothetical protein ANN_16873 [Periplaneta americana]